MLQASLQVVMADAWLPVYKLQLQSGSQNTKLSYIYLQNLIPTEDIE